MAETFSTPFGDIDPAAVEAATAAAAEADGRKDIGEITIKFAKSQGMKQLMAGGGIALIGITLVPLLSGLFG